MNKHSGLLSPENTIRKLLLFLSQGSHMFPPHSLDFSLSFLHCHPLTSTRMSPLGVHLDSCRLRKSLHHQQMLMSFLTSPFHRRPSSSQLITFIGFVFSGNAASATALTRAVFCHYLRRGFLQKPCYSSVFLLASCTSPVRVVIILNLKAASHVPS